MTETSSNLYERIPGGTIEAIQLTSETRGLLSEWTNEAFQPTNGVFPDRLWVAANSASLDIVLGEWVAKDSLGFYPIKNEVFVKTWRKPANPFEKASAIRQMSGGEFLEYLGIDAEKWAHEFATMFREKYAGEDLDTITLADPGDLVHAWFVNAIGAGESAGYSRAMTELKHD